MFRKIPFGVLLLFALIFVGFGDQFLPKSIGRYSYQMRSTVENIIVSGFPNWQPKTNPSARTKDAIKNVEGN